MGLRQVSLPRTHFDFLLSYVCHRSCHVPRYVPRPLCTYSSYPTRCLTAFVYICVFDLGSAKHNVQYGSLFFSIPGIYIVAPTLTTWLANNATPHTRRATAIAITFILTNSGGILATWLLGSLSPPPTIYQSNNYTSYLLYSHGCLLCAQPVVPLGSK
jgi:hypothetical protein